MAVRADIEFMQRALDLARRGQFKTSPNPMVGAVIVKNGSIIGEGYHRRAGGPHAEIVALKKAKGLTKGSTLYVTLEPCCHTGRTGPCTDAIIKAGIKKVVFAVKDPDIRVNGKGGQKLRQAGIEVVNGVLKKEAVSLNEAYFGYYKNKRPYIILKMAQTLDGRIASLTGDSQWISGAQSRRMAHMLRAEVDGVVVGLGTIKHDNPSLTVREIKGPDPYRIVISGSLKFPHKCKLLDNNKDYKTIIATSNDTAERFSKKKQGKNVIYWRLRKNRDGFLDINDLVAQADSFGLRSLLVEGGSQVATSFLKAGLVDKIMFFVAPVILGEGIDTIGDLKKRRLSEALLLRDVEFKQSGKDCLFIGYPRWSK